MNIGLKGRQIISLPREPTSQSDNHCCAHEVTKHKAGQLSRGIMFALSFTKVSQLVSVIMISVLEYGNRQTHGTL
jgi:hypothetical protein